MTRAITVLGASLLVALAALPAEAQSGPRISGSTLVGTRRLTRTTSEFTFRATLTNPLPVALPGAAATLTSLSPNTVVVDGALAFGDVGAGASAPSLDTYTIRQNLAVAFDPAHLLWAIGVRLPGAPGAPAVSATFDLPPASALPSEIVGGLIMSRLDVRLTPDATVAQVNAALNRVGGGIASMARGFSALTVSISRQPTVAALEALVATLAASPGIAAVHPAVTSAADLLPSVNAKTIDHQLLPTRFPAAWNARSLAVDPASGSCRQPHVPVLVGDKFVRPAPLVFDIGFSFLTFAHEIPNFLPSPIDESLDDSHGYDVTLFLGALFNPDAKTGANPFSQCLDITGVMMGALTGFQEIDRLAQNFPSGKFILNLSRSWGKICADAAVPPAQGAVVVPCEPRHFGSVIPNAAQRADDVLYWKERTFSRWPDFLVTTSAGNSLDDEIAAIYPTLGTATFNSFINAATLPDPLLRFADDAVLWQPAIPGFSTLAATPAQAFRLTSTIFAIGLDQVGGAGNVLRVGSTSRGDTFADLVESPFSNSDPDVLAVGESVLTADLTAVNGTSFSAPQVAGLASYLWLLSPSLRAMPSPVTRRAIVENARQTASAGAVVDAYATILSLDGVSLPTAASAPVRLAILDANDDGRFDTDDLAAYVQAYIDPATGDPIEPAVADYGRLDLNGDGFTGGSRPERFDLDRVGSTQFGATQYGVAEQQIEGERVSFSESAVTDLQVLCYYAYSDLYTTGAGDRRGELLAGLCAPITVQVSPAGTTLSPGGTQQFSATVRGVMDPRVTWTATGGVITATGAFTAGTTPGTFTVRAISVADPSVFGDATVEVRSGFIIVGDLDVDGFDPLNQLANLAEVTGNLRVVRGNGLATSVSLPSLRRVGGSLTVRDNSSATSVRLPVLEAVGGDVLVLNNAALTRFEVPSLQTAARLTVSQNPVLTDVAVGPATLNQGNGTLLISLNAALRSLSGFSSGLVVGSLTIQNNASLSTAEAFALAGRITVRGSILITGNTGQ